MDKRSERVSDKKKFAMQEAAEAVKINYYDDTIIFPLPYLVKKKMV